MHARACPPRPDGSCSLTLRRVQHRGDPVIGASVAQQLAAAKAPKTWRVQRGSCSWRPRCTQSAHDERSECLHAEVVDEQLRLHRHGQLAQRALSMEGQHDSRGAHRRIFTLSATSHRHREANACAATATSHRHVDLVGPRRGVSGAPRGRRYIELR